MSDIWLDGFHRSVASPSDDVMAVNAISEKNVDGGRPHTMISVSRRQLGCVTYGWHHPCDGVNAERLIFVPCDFSLFRIRACLLEQPWTTVVKFADVQPDQLERVMRPQREVIDSCFVGVSVFWPASMIFFQPLFVPR